MVLCGLLIGSRGISYLVEYTEMGLDVVDPYLCEPLSCSLMEGDALNAGGIRLRQASVRHILRTGRRAQIAPAIIAFGTVYVINVTVGPFAGYPCPCDAMRFIVMSEEHDDPVTF